MDSVIQDTKGSNKYLANLAQHVPETNATLTTTYTKGQIFRETKATNKIHKEATQTETN